MTYAHPEYLISPAELAADLDSANRCILDATVFLKAASGGYRAESGLAKYKACHIPGAMFLDLIEAASDTTTGLGFSLPPVGQLESLFRSLGVGNDTEVVLYSTGHMMWATRAWWLFRYCGHRRVRVLNGGFRGWRKGHHPKTRVIPPVRAGNFAARPDPGLFVDKDDVLTAIGHPGACTVNALPPDAYSGESKTHYGRKGHIATSINVFYDDLLHRGRFKEDAALRAVLDAKGLLDTPRVIAYCGGGISATVDAFACLLAGHDNVAVYDGSMAEWSRDESLPMETGH